MVVQDLLQELRVIVEGESHMADLSLSFQLLGDLKGVSPLVLPVILTVERVHQIEIKVRYPADLELIFKQRPDVFFSFEAAVRQLVGEHERLPWIPVSYAALYHLLAHAAVIDTRRVEISESGFHEPVDHLVT